MALDQVNNGDKGNVARDKINAAIDEANKVANKMDKVPSATENNAAIFDAEGQIKDAGGVPLIVDLDNVDIGDKLIVDDTGEGITTAPSTTSSGFYDRSAISIVWDNGLSTLFLNGTFDFVTSNGKKFSKTNDSIIITPVDGLIYIYYDNDGNLQQLNNPNRDQQYSIMLITLPVSYFLYSLTFGDALFVGDYMKGRVSTGLWVKNFFDQVIETLTPLLVTGLTGGSGSVDADAQFGLSESEFFFIDNKYNSPTRANTDTWNVGFFSGSEALGLPDHPYPVLIDTDLAAGVTGRIVYNNGGNPLPASSGNYVWYFLAITNDIEGVDRTLTFMGDQEHGTVGVAEDALANEVATIKSKLSVKQGFNLKKAILYETKSTFANAVKGRIVEVLDLFVEGGGSPSVSVPDDLINGSDASSLHNHNSLYATVNKHEFAASDEDSDLELGVVFRQRLTRPLNVSEIYIGATTAPTGSNLIVDFLKNGVSILSTLVSIDAGEFVSNNAAIPPVITTPAFAIGDELSVEITQIGSTVAGKGLKCLML